MQILEINAHKYGQMIFDKGFTSFDWGRTVFSVNGIGKIGWMPTWKRIKLRDFSCSPVVNASCFQCRGMGSIPGQGTKILHAVQHSQEN